MVNLRSKQLIIVLDSAGSGGKSKYRPYICVWAAFLYNFNLRRDTDDILKNISENDRYEADILSKYIDPKPIRFGVIYSDYTGPNKIFYDGIIRALDACRFLIKINNPFVKDLIIVGDCQPVIYQLNGKRKVNQMKSLYKQVKHFEYEYRKFNVNTIYKWVQRDKYPLYKEIDRLAKKFLEEIKRSFKIKP